MNDAHTLERPIGAPSLYSTDGRADDSLVVAHYFLPGTNADWFVLEYDELEDIIFGFANIIPGCGELGSTSLKELEDLTIAVPIRIGTEIRYIPTRVELDKHWTPKPLRTVLKDRGIK
jgi:Protein of unknown function (DUF2958)